jgi:hypothetical protein
MRICCSALKQSEQLKQARCRTNPIVVAASRQELGDAGAGGRKHLTARHKPPVDTTHSAAVPHSARSS